jgi:phage head maturation protease
VLLEHGRDPVVARRPLGPIRELREDERGVRYAFGLLDTDYNRELLPGLRAGLFGSSFRGRIEGDVDPWPERSLWNPGGLPERTVHRVSMLMDLGPTSFPIYLGTSALARSAEPGVWTPARRGERLVEVL